MWHLIAIRRHSFSVMTPHACAYYPVAIIMSASLLLVALGVFIKMSGSISMEISMELDSESSRNPERE